MKKILIIGASSGIGLNAVKLALAHGHYVKAFARGVKRINISHPNLEKISGDATNPQDVEAALKGVDAVIQSLGVPMGLKLITGPILLFSKSTKILLQAMKDNSVNRLITITGFGAGDSRNSINFLQRIAFEAIFGRAYRDKDIQEHLIKDSGLDWTIVRPGVLTNSTARKPKVLLDPSRWRNGCVSRATVATFLVQQVESNELVGECPVLIS